MNIILRKKKKTCFILIFNLGVAREEKLATGLENSLKGAPYFCTVVIEEIL